MTLSVTVSLLFLLSFFTIITVIMFVKYKNLILVTLSHNVSMITELNHEYRKHLLSRSIIFAFAALVECFITFDD